MGDQGKFELEPEPPEQPAIVTPKPVPAPRPPSVSATPTAKRIATTPPPETGPLSFLEPRARKRLRRVVPIFVVAFVIVGWLFVGTGVWAFALAGAAVGVFAAFRRWGEGALGTAAGVAAYAATAAAIHGLPLGFLMVVVVGICGGIGALMAIDDRLRGSAPLD